MNTLLQQIFIVLWIAMCGYAYVRGGLPERVVATVFVVGALASMAVGPPGDHPFDRLEEGILLVDSAMFIVLSALALLSARYWPLAMASLQGAEVLGHLARLVDNGVLPHSYFTLTVMWSFPMLGLLGLGTWRHRRRLRRYGRDYAWSWQIPRGHQTQGVQL